MYATAIPSWQILEATVNSELEHLCKDYDVESGEAAVTEVFEELAGDSPDTLDPGDPPFSFFF